MYAKIRRLCMRSRKPTTAYDKYIVRVRVSLSNKMFSEDDDVFYLPPSLIEEASTEINYEGVV